MSVATVDAAGALAPPKPRHGSTPSLLLTLFGDYWFGNAVPLPSAALLTLLSDFDVSEVAARAALSRMVKHGLLDSTKSGRNAAYLPTHRGNEVLVDGLARLSEFGARERAWDGVWSVVVVSAPGNNRRLREAIRSRMRWLGFAPLAESVWVSPHRGPADAIAELATLGLRDVTAFAGSVPAVDGGPRRPESAWALDSLAGEYREFIERAEGLAAALDADSLDDGQALVHRTRLAYDWLELSNADPDLPRALLPDSWPRADARSAFIDLHGRLGRRAVGRVREVVGAIDASLASLVVHRVIA